MDGWMDGWMDGSHLAAGQVVVGLFTARVLKDQPGEKKFEVRHREDIKGHHEWYCKGCFLTLFSVF